MDLPANFWAKVDKNGSVPSSRPDLGSCWLWTGALDRNGYGRFCMGRRPDRVWRFPHRLAYEEFVGRTELGLDHLCRVRNCLNPDHLEAVTQAVNVRRGVQAGTFGRVMRNKTHCPQGHPYAGDNLLVKHGARYCIECNRKYSREYMRKRRLRLAEQVAV